MFWRSDVTSGTPSARAMRRYELRARAARAAVVRALLIGTARGIADWFRRRLGPVACRLRARRACRQAVNALASLDTRTLADIGVRRDDVEAMRLGACAKPFARDPCER